MVGCGYTAVEEGQLVRGYLSHPRSKNRANICQFPAGTQFVACFVLEQWIDEANASQEQLGLRNQHKHNDWQIPLRIIDDGQAVKDDEAAALSEPLGTDAQEKRSSPSPWGCPSQQPSAGQRLQAVTFTGQ